MNKTGIGILLIVGGAAYGSLAIDKVNELTLGKLMKYNFLKGPSTADQAEIKVIEKSPFGRKGTMLSYAAVLIGLGIYLILTPNV